MSEIPVVPTTDAGCLNISTDQMGRLTYWPDGQMATSDHVQRAEWIVEYCTENGITHDPSTHRPRREFVDWLLAKEYVVETWLGAILAKPPQCSTTEKCENLAQEMRAYAERDPQIDRQDKQFWEIERLMKENDELGYALAMLLKRTSPQLRRTPAWKRGAKALGKHCDRLEKELAERDPQT